MYKFTRYLVFWCYYKWHLYISFYNHFCCGYIDIKLFFVLSLYPVSLLNFVLKSHIFILFYIFYTCCYAISNTLSFIYLFLTFELYSFCFTVLWHCWIEVMIALFYFWSQSESFIYLIWDLFFSPGVLCQVKEASFLS